MRAVAVTANRVQCALNPGDVQRRAVRGLDSACSAGSIVWIVPVDGGVVLIDAGFDESGEQIKEALHGRTVKAILITHGHLDHRAAAHLFGAPVYIGRADVDLLEGHRGCEAPVAILGDIVGVPPRPKTVIPVDDGNVLVIGGRTFEALALPGHTPGSTGWLTGRVLFTGDAIQGPLDDGELFPAPGYVTDDMRAAYQSLRKLRSLDVDAILDGHFGVTRRLHDGIEHAIARSHDESALDSQPLLRPAGCREGDTVPFASSPIPVVEAVATAPVAVEVSKKLRGRGRTPRADAPRNPPAPRR